MTQIFTMYCRLLRFKIYTMICRLNLHDVLSVRIYTSTQATEWHRYITWPWITFYDAINAALFSKGINPDWFSRMISWQDLTYALLGIAISVYSFFRLRLSIAFFVLISMLFFYTNHGPFGYAFWSIPRYMATLFPIYLILATLTIRLPHYVRWSLLFVSMGLLGLLTAWFTSGRWVA